MQALLVIDMLNDFINEDGALPVKGARRIIPEINKRIKEFRERGEPIIFICDAHDEDDKEFKIWPRHAVKGSYGAKVIKELDKREEDIVVEKKTYSAFFNTELDKILKEKGIDTLALTGVLTNICVLHTAADAAMHGYNVIVYKDAVATVDEETQRFALKHMKTVLNAKVI